MWSEGDFSAGSTSACIQVKDFGTFDLVVVGGGCTGVFAAIRAARLGLKVAIIERSNCFGGVAAYLSLQEEKRVDCLDGKEVRKQLQKGGSAL